METTLEPKPSRSWPWIMLVFRTGMFALWQAVIAGLYLLTGAAFPWLASTAWWPVVAFLANLVTLFVLLRLCSGEGLRFWDIFRFQRATLKGDLLVLLGFMIVVGPIALLPSFFLGTALFGNYLSAVDMLYHPLPLWAILPALFLFPITIAIVELPNYFAYSMPRLEKQVGAVLAVLLASAGLSLQHATLPLIFDWRFIVWRALMFLPFALLIGLVLRWRPHLLPYLVIIHGLLDFAAAWMVLSISR